MITKEIRLREILTEICLNYQIEIIEQTKRQETQKNNTDTLDRFIASKEIEGCSTRTLNYYRDNINKMLDYCKSSNKWNYYWNIKKLFIRL